jgi:hypothetical protein
MPNIEGGRHACGRRPIRCSHRAPARNSAQRIRPKRRRSLLGGAEVELDVSVGVTGSGGIKFWVVNREAGSTHARAARVKVNLRR